MEQAQKFIAKDIPTKFIMDSAVGMIMEEVDLCVVGAEGVMENGGIINKVVSCFILCVESVLIVPG